MSINANYGITAAANTPEYDYYLDCKAGTGDSIMSEGISVLYKFMTLFTDLTKNKYDQMSVKADRARTSQQMANEVDAKVADLAKPGDRATLPDDVIQYLRDHRIPITALNNGTNSASDIDAYISANGRSLNQGQLNMIKGALETDSGRCSDFVTQAQLQIQKSMQSYNVCVSLINSMQTLLAEMIKSIAQNIR